MSWDNLPFGLPNDFDFTAVETPEAASILMSLLPNRDRGTAAKRLYDLKLSVGRNVAYRALMDGWELIITR
jgi:hypothetical protein